MKHIHCLALFCGILTLLTVPGVSLGVVLPTQDWRANDAPQRTHLPHARAASFACEYAFAGEIAQPQAELCPGEVAPTSIASPRIARVGAGSHLGTPRDLLGSDGSVRWSAAYTAWGKIYEEYVADTQGPRGPPAAASTIYDGAPDGAIRSAFRLLGQYFDEETGLSATRFRMWEAETGRWLSPDPLGLLGSSNLFGAEDSPTSDVDPLGLAYTPPLPTTGANSTVLRQNLVREGRIANPGDAAAHLVPSGGAMRHWAPAIQSREILERYRININDAANGAFLDSQKHGRTHAGAFHRGVLARLQAVEQRMKAQNYGRKAIRAALRRELRAISKCAAS